MSRTVAVMAAVLVMAAGAGLAGPLTSGGAERRWWDPGAGPAAERPPGPAEDCEQPEERPAGPVCVTAEDVRVGGDDVDPVGGCVCV